MRTRSKLMLAALASALLLAALVGTASANSLSFTEQGFKVMYSPLSFVPSFGSTIRCPITLEGSLHTNTFAKTASLLLGFVTRTTIGTCESGRMRLNTETLPWHIEYSSFSGTLPNITSIDRKILGWSWELEGEIFGLRVKCRYTTSSQLVIDTREARGVLTEERPGTESTLSETEGCPSLRQSGTGSVKTSSGGTISLHLITNGSPPSLAPSPVEFGRVEAEGVASRSVTITAIGEATRINSISVTTGTYFAILDPNRCVGSTLAVRASCSFKAIFAAPRETERSFEDRVVVESSFGRSEDTLRAST